MKQRGIINIAVVRQKNNFNKELSKKMNDMRRKSPREFWKMFKSKPS